jgi:hypothetical protein
LAVFGLVSAAAVYKQQASLCLQHREVDETERMSVLSASRIIKTT